jgi:uncharacterized repeat protein (TIGR01451 family)
MFAMSRRPDRTARSARQAKARRLIFEPLEGRELLSAIPVTTAADNGDNNNPTPGSLRAAIITSNTMGTVGGNTIQFNIASSGVQTIALQSPLPTITTTVVIDGLTEPGTPANDTPIVVIDGSGAGVGANGLTIGAGGGGSIIRGLSIVGFTGDASGNGGTGIVLAGSTTAGGNQISDDYIGIEPDGSTAKANGTGIVVVSPNNTIGGSIALTSNLISGNAGSGVLLAGPSATGNLVTGNFIGTNAAATVAVGNEFGVLVMASNNTIGGVGTGAGNVISGNVGPQGNTGAGIIFEGTASNNVVLGNKIGTNAAGTAAVIPSGFTPPLNYSNAFGIYFGTPITMPGQVPTDILTGEIIGGSVAGAGNLISGDFVGITGDVDVTSFLIAGNTIGLNLAGTAPISNGDGIVLTASSTTIGGTTPLARNVISGNSSSIGFNTMTGMASAAGTGLELTGASDVVEGNYIGVASSGAAAPGTGNFVGLLLGDSASDSALASSTIGSTAAGAGNVIAGNASDGIQIADSGGSNAFFGNVIGADFQGVADGNAGDGIDFIIPAPTSTPTSPLLLDDSIGGTTQGAGNLIAHSGGAGILVLDNDPVGVAGLGIRGNVIFANAHLGIDTENTRIPVATSLFINSDTVANGKVTVGGVYFDTPGTSVSIDLFANSADPSGFGQGPIFLGTVSATTNAQGFANFSGTFTSPATPFSAFSATFTGTSGNTSEFTANFPTVASASVADIEVAATSSVTTVTVGDTVTLVEQVANAGPGTANGVVLFDSLPISFVNGTVTSSIGTATITNNVVTADLGTLLPGTFATVTITGMVSQAGSLIDEPGASSTTFDPNYANNIATQVITVTPSSTGPSADLAVLTGATTSTTLIGTPVTYIVSVGNLGPNTAGPLPPPADQTQGVMVFDTIPAGSILENVTATQGTLTVQGNLLIFNLGTLASGAVVTISIVVVPTVAGPITNLATVSGPQTDPVSGNNRAVVTTTATPNINLFLAMSPSPAVGAVGQPQTFLMTFENFGFSSATNVFLVDNLPSNVTFVSATPSQGGPANLVNGQLTVNFGTLAPGAIATLRLIVTPKVLGPITNVAGVFSFDVPSIPAVFASSTVSVIAGPSVSAINGSGNNAVLVLNFNEALNPTTAMNLANYQLASLGPKGTSAPQTIKIALITYNATAHTVTILAAQPIDPTQFYRLTLIGATPSGIADTSGRRLASTVFGPAGSNFAATFFAGTLPQV